MTRRWLRHDDRLRPGRHRRERHGRHPRLLSGHPASRSTTTPSGGPRPASITSTSPCRAGSSSTSTATNSPPPTTVGGVPRQAPGPATCSTSRSWNETVSTRSTASSPDLGTRAPRSHSTRSGALGTPSARTPTATMLESWSAADPAFRRGPRSLMPPLIERQRSIFAIANERNEARGWRWNAGRLPWGRCRMRALSVIPGRAGTAEMVDRPEPQVSGDVLLVRSRAIGICGTDAEIIAGDYGEAPPGEQRLVLGHESLGEVVEAPAGSGFEPGQLVVGVVRRPDPVPCDHCAVGEWDMCRNDLYTESGIKQRHGYAQEWYTLEPGFAVPVDEALGDLGVLVEPASVVAKAGAHAVHFLQRSEVAPRTALITGAGPIGLLAASLRPSTAWTPTWWTSSTADPSRTWWRSSARPTTAVRSPSWRSRRRW